MNNMETQGKKGIVFYKDYEGIERPYNTFLYRSDQNIENGNVETQPVKSDGAMADIWIKNFIRSENWKPKSVGFYIDGQTGHAEFSDVYISGTIVALAGTIGGFDIGSDYIRDVANSFGMASTVTVGNDVRFWAGDTFANRATAEFRVYENGDVTAASITITGGSVSGASLASIPNSTATDISLLSNSHNLVFSVTDADTIAWSTGTIVLSNGRTFTISAGNTGNMVALTYIYLDTGASLTVLQTTTTYSTAMGANKLLVGTAQNNTVTASFIPFDGSQPLIDGGLIGALSIVAGNIAATTITAAKMNVTDLSAISANIGTITAGSISVISGGNTIGLTPSGTNAIFSGTTGSPEFKVTPAGVLTATGATITGIIQTATGTGVRIVATSADNTLTFYNSSNAAVTQLGGGVSIANALRINLDAATQTGVKVTSATSGDFGFQYISAGNYAQTGMNIQMTGATNTGDGVKVNHTGSSGNAITLATTAGAQGLLITNAGSGTSIYITSSETTSGSSIFIDHRGYSSIGIDMTYRGRSYGIYMDGTDAASTQSLMYVRSSQSDATLSSAHFDKTTIGPVVYITSTNASNSNYTEGIRFNLASSGTSVEVAFVFNGSEYTNGGIGLGRIAGIVKVVTSAGLVHMPVYKTTIVTTLSNSATPSVAESNLFITGGTTTITQFNNGVVGQTIQVLSAHAITITDGTNILLNASTNFVMAVGDTLVLTMFNSGVWEEVGRKTN